MPSDIVLKDLYDREAWFEGGERGGYEDYDAQTAPSLPLVTSLLNRLPGSEKKRSILDIGCGYGTHLRLAADGGWKCYGVEPSAHAREVARERHGDRLVIVERAEDLLPQRFDVILMLEVIEHLRDPYPLFFTLFGKGAIDVETLVVFTTPNARSNDAVADPGGWAYRHPPSHLVFYSAKALEILLRRLMFKEVGIRGIVPLLPRPPVRFDDEQPSINDELSGFLGLLVEARGSDFHEFMRERYVPGSYWKLTEYEHLPRYAFACTLARGARVLDFGCGTGYGAASLAEAAESVVGLDISAPAIEWARQMHRDPRLKFDLRSDLGRGLAAGSFDLVTCFEVIEHVDHRTQKRAIRSIAKLLTPGGRLVISTPDPQFTASYGDNPYHLREMTEAEFLELLRSGFKHVTMLRQWVRPSILIGPRSLPDAKPIVFGPLAQGEQVDSLVGFVAVCSNEPFVPPPQFCQFDTASDFNLQTLETEHRLNRLRFDNYKLADGKEWLEGQVRAHVEALKECDRVLAETRAWMESQTQDLAKQVQERDRALAESREYADALTRGNEWLKGQVRTHEEALKERDRGLAETRAWLESQTQEFQKQVQDLDRALAETRDWVATLDAGKAWLEGQVRAYEAAMQERGRVLAETRSELEGQVRVLEAQLKDRDRTLLETNARIAAIERSKGWRLLRFLRLVS